ncbi:MAG TPA: nucleoside hydrolase [Steroidobacteraceae bacterium]|nr:nucleoside hydrolase [Steroidobacteraceae bacterium]
MRCALGRLWPLILIALALPTAALAGKRLVIVDQDTSGPGGSNIMSIMALLQSPEVEVLGITVVTGNAWRDDEARHALRMLELIGRSDVPVALGAVFPLVRTQEETRLMMPVVGKVAWLGAWGQKLSTLPTPAGLVEPPAPPAPLGPWDTPPLVEGNPHTKPIAEDAVHFLIRQVHAHPHEVTIYAAGPLTDIALATALDPHFAALTRGLVVMGSSLNPHTDDPEFATNPRHEFNFWFDPEAARMTLRAPWPRIDVTTVDVSIKAMFTQQMVDAIAKSSHPAARYIAKYSQERYYLWDELAACAWLDPSIITRAEELYMDVDVTHGPTYGDTLTWTKDLKPALDVHLVHAQVDLDLPKFTRMFVALMSAPTPHGQLPAGH